MGGRKKWVAMLLAGGQGSRLKELTNFIAKPAVPFGGKYRIIDFALSNCTHSGIDTVGVVTQYQPHILNSYVGNGRAWDLDRNFGGVSVLPPFKGQEGGRWYSGTANAVYQNIHYIKQFDPEYVLIISADHIYKMDYNQMLQFHIEKGAQASIAVIQVPWNDASRFGIMNTDENGRILEFQEKPKFPQSNLASMGVYIFNWKLLKEYLIKDELTKGSSNDFGNDIIPRMLIDKINLYAYKFHGYWKDVGTVQSLWEAHMDLLEENPAFNLDDPAWRIYAGNANNPPQYISPQATVKQSLINEGCMIYGKIERSVLSYNVTVGEGTVIKNSVVMPEAKIGKNVLIENSIVACDAIIEDGVTLGNSALTDEITLVTKNNQNSTTVKEVY